MAQSRLLDAQEGYVIDPMLVCGEILCGTYPATASVTQVLTAGSDLIATSVLAGTVGNAYDLILAADASAKASLDCSTLGITTSAGTFDTILEMVTGGTDGNAWRLDIIPHGILGGGVVIVENLTAKNISVLYEAGVSTITNFETAVAGCTYIAVKTGGTGARVLNSGSGFDKAFTGGTAVTWALQVGNVTTVHFTDGVSTAGNVETVCNALSGKNFSVSAETPADLVVAADAGTQNLSGGIDAVACVLAKGTVDLTVTQTATGVYTLTGPEDLTVVDLFVSGIATLRTASGSNMLVSIKTSATPGVFLISTYEPGVGLSDAGSGADRICFELTYSA